MNMMRAAAIGLLFDTAVAVSLMPSAHADDRAFVEHVRSRLFTETENLERQNYRPVQAAVIEETSKAQTRRFVLRLEEGVQYAVVAACDQDSNHLELSLFDGQRALMTKTPEASDVVILGGTPPVSGFYELEIAIPGCRQTSCHTGLAILQSGATQSGPVIVARSDSGPPKVAGFTQRLMIRKEGFELEADNYREAQVGSFEECEQLCAADQRCSAIEFYKQKRSCGLFNKVPSMKRASGVDIAIKKAAGP